MTISIVIPAYNEERYIEECLSSILNCKDPDVRQIIVVNNASTDRTAAIVRRFPEVTLIDEPRKGVGRARQRGLEAATGDLYAGIDADTRVTPAWFSHVKKFFNEHPDAVALSGPYLYYDLPRWKQWVKDHLEALARFDRSLRGRTVVRVTGGNAVFRMEALRRVNGFNVNIPFYGDDIDVGLRLQKVGKVYFEPHFRSSSSARRLRVQGMFRTLFLYKLNAMWLNMTGKPFLTQPAHDVR